MSTATLPGTGDNTTATVYRWRWVALAVILGAEIMDLIDATVTVIAAPTIRAELGGGNAMMQWLAAGYTVAFAVGLITGGRLGDIYGRRRMFLIGAAGFTLSSVLCGLAMSPELLVSARIVQGAFGALMIPQGLGLIRQVFPPRELAAAFGAFGPVMGLAAVCGPILAGVLIDVDLFGAGWRMIFLVNLPVGLLAIAGGLRFLPESPRDRGQRIDLVGTLIIMAALGLIMYPLVQGHELGWPTWTFVMMAAAVPVLGLFVVHERRHQRAGRDPLVVPSLFRKPAFRGGLLFGLMFFAGMTGIMLVFGLFIQLGLGYGPLKAGLTNIPMALGTGVGAGLGAGLAAKFGRKVLHGGAATMLLGVAGQYLTLQLAGVGVAPWQLAPALLVTGVGMGMTLAPFFDIVLACVEEREVGSASGTLTATQQLANAMGVAVLGTIFFSLLGGHPSPAGFTSAMQVVLLIELAVLGLAYGLAFLLPRHARQQEQNS